MAIKLEHILTMDTTDYKNAHLGICAYDEVGVHYIGLHEIEHADLALNEFSYKVPENAVIVTDLRTTMSSIERKQDTGLVCLIQHSGVALIPKE